MYYFNYTKRVEKLIIKKGTQAIIYLKKTLKKCFISYQKAIKDKIQFKTLPKKKYKMIDLGYPNRN